MKSNFTNLVKSLGFLNSILEYFKGRDTPHSEI